ncbi:MAG: carboxymuconolactone decarboxylase family protein [Opitutales bacterium]|nr:carboxymuconolactone decarboxylase family protein [Opitutales bacterium]
MASRDWKSYATELEKLFGGVMKGQPEVVKGFAQMGKAVKADGALTEKTKELIALGIAISIRCESCIAFHARNAVKAGASREEVLETVGTCIYMGGGPSFGYGAQALEAFDQFSAD